MLSRCSTEARYGVPFFMAKNCEFEHNLCPAKTHLGICTMCQ
ncbi:Uncharacterised protein [Serratia fonticola]|nr:Uncharacterised protein [Serratia fonticola]